MGAQRKKKAEQCKQWNINPYYNDPIFVGMLP